MNLSLNDLDRLRYIDVAKMMLVTIKEQNEMKNEKQPDVREATQNDINTFLK